MRALKYRSLEQLGFAFDILFSNRLYCARAEELNDPMEGAFGTMVVHSVPDAHVAAKQVELFSEQLRICSLSQTCGEHLLWTHYASAFTGLAIEVDLPESTTYNPTLDEGHIRIKQVDCSGRAHLGTLPHNDPRSAAYERYASKERHWEYEREIRIVANVCALENGSFYRLSEKPRAVYLGFRMPTATKFALGAICEKLEIPLAIVSPVATEIPSIDINFPKGLKWPGGQINLLGMPMD